MEQLQVIRSKMLQDIHQIDGGWKTLSEKMNVSQWSLQKTLDPKHVKKPRLSTLKKIKEGIQACLDDQQSEYNKLLN